MHDRLAHILNDLKKPYEDAALNIIAKQADGSMRDALSIAEKIIISCDKLTVEHVKKSLCLMDDELSLSLLKSIVEGNGVDVLNLIHTIYEEGKNLSHMIDNLLTSFTDAILLIATNGNAILYNSNTYKQELFSVVQNSDLDLMFWYVDQISILREKIRNSLNPYMETQVYLIRCCNPKLLNDNVRNLLSRITCLEKKLQELEKGVPVLPKSNQETVETTKKYSVNFEQTLRNTEEWKYLEKNPFSEPKAKEEKSIETQDSKTKNEVTEEDDKILKLFSDYL